MSGVIRGSCKACNLLQSVSPIRGYLQNHQSYNTRQYLYRTLTSTSKSRRSIDAAVKKEPDFFNTLVEEKTNLWQNIEHDVSDPATFEIVKQHYLQKLEQLKIEEVENEKAASEEIVPKKYPKKKKKKPKPVTAKYTPGNQLTYQGEQNILAEIDIYVYLGEVSKAYNLFNFHRRHGHKFSIDAYNKLIHAWASQCGWKNISILYQSLKREGFVPNYQTFAGLLEAAGYMKDEDKVNSIIADMESQGMDVHKVLTSSTLSKQQIEVIVNALSIMYPYYKQEYEEALSKKDNVNSSENQYIFDLIKKQMQLELKGCLTVKSIDTTRVDNINGKKRADLYQQIIAQWKSNFITELIKAGNAKNNRPSIYMRCITYTNVLSPTEIADVVFDQIVPVLCAQPNGLPVSYICRRLGYLLYLKFSSKYRDEKGVAEKVQRIAEEYCSSEEWLNTSITTPREKWNDISKSLPYLSSEDLHPTMWPTKLRTMASSVLLDILKKVAVIDTSIFIKSKHARIEQCLSHHKELIGPNNIGIMSFHPALNKLYTAYVSQLGDISFEVNKLPSYIPPRPWSTPTSGAYLLLHTDLVRTITGQYKLNQLTAAAKGGQLNQIYDSLNYLGNCKWRVNGRILDLMIHLFNGKGDIGLDIIGPDLPIVEEVKAKKAMTYAERQSRQRQRKLYHELFALRMDLLYKLSIANHFRDDVFWTPSNLDFRGRAYPIAPHCSHIGSDVARGLLVFADGKKLGASGLDWLKVHLVNVHGQLKKSSLKDRIKYADENIDDIFDSADNPLEGNGWWKGGSDPWQTLVACIEITNAIRSNHPEEYVSHIAVHQDGSCNGLQHYAALGLDSYGAKQVNLTPSVKPQDVYTEVANLVEKKRKVDAENGLLLAQQLEGKVIRKVVKQTVMTVVYGVTFVGGRLQIEKQLKDVGVPNEIIFKASVYVVKEVFASLAQMFTSARQIQEWLTIAAAQISLTGNCVDWVTPLGLPVIQPYHRETSESIHTPLQFVSTQSTYDHTQVPHLTKQKGGLPPNFVHSLDSCHMMLTALRCQDERMTFASVHDSFWTHACDVDKLNEFTREEFVTLHQLPILTDLKKHFDEKYTGLDLRTPMKDGTTKAKFPELPKSGTFDITQVLDSVYFFS